ncbi:subtilase-type protease inhibitor [Streptomyces sp. NPDC051662]|uniref:subtilase-type protease inhibitor n=1 Tax=Streptomyces sp. NPDC051662 TaxID=3154750 RepID=UPI003433E17B
MRSIATGLALTATTLALTALPATGTASAEQAVSASLYAPSALVLSVTGGADTVTGTVLRAVTLSCAPQASGTHPDPAGACAELRAAQGRLDAITTPAPHISCTREWNPVTVTADGVWEGKRFSYVHTFSNPCARDNGSGTVFAF